MFEIKTEWLTEFIQKLADLNAKDSIDRGIKKGIYLLEWLSKIETPVDTWVLRNSYRTEFLPWIWKLINFREYWLYVHEWTKYIKWNPFLERAVQKWENWLVAIFAKEVDLLLNNL